MNELVWWFGQNTLAALLMIPCVMLACRLFRDRPAVQHLLWLVILLKFITPPIVVWPWSVDELRSMAWSQMSDQQRVSLEPSPADPIPELIAPRSVPTESATAPKVPAPSIEPSSLPDDTLVVTDNANEKAETTTLANWIPIFANTAILAWFIGAIVCSVSQLRRLARYARLVRSGEVAPTHLKAEVASVASLLNMKAPVSVVVKGIVSPFLWCVGPAKLAWPESLSSQADVVRSRGIIAHELAHLRRRDHWITWLELGASILWWWNPLFWYVRRQLRETAEMSCDALAIAANPVSRREYAELLLQLSSQSTNGVPAPVIAMGAGNVASFERRLKMILSSNVSGNLSWRGALALAVLAVIALPYWSLAQTANRESSQNTSAQSSTVKESPRAAAPNRENDSPDTDETRRPGTRRTIAVNDVTFSFRWCPSGEFLMGSPEDKRSQYGSAFVSQHHVTLTRGFWLSEFEITQAQYEMVTGENPSFWKPFNPTSVEAIEREHTTNNPVEQVSWDDASSFCQELTKLAAQHRFRLPTEAEWEYACRAGRPECRYGEINDIAWVFENTEIGVEGSFGHRKVGLKAPNAWGLHDMFGNVAEWCSDWSGPPATQPTVDPTGPTSGESRIARGGNCFADQGGLHRDGRCLAGTRDHDGGPPYDRVRTRGFRIVLVADVDPRQLGTDAQEGKTGSTSVDPSKTSEIAMRNQGDKNAADEKAKVSAKEKVEPWEISKLYEAAFLRTYLQDHEALPKPIVVPRVSGKVLDPDGNPASGVRIVSHTPRQWVDLDATLALKPHNSGGVKNSRQDGTFGMPERTEPYRVLLVHESGVANVSHEELLRANGKVTLQKWASLSGTLKLGGQPQAGETIVLQFDTLPWSYSRLAPRLTTTHLTTTDKDGNFSFDRVPPLGGMARSLRGHGTVYQCESGKNTHVEIGAGITVTGKLSIPEHVEKDKLKVYARNHLLPIPYPKDWTDDVTKEERLAWRMKWSATAEGSAIEDKNHILMNSMVPGAITEDGRFTIYGVPERPMVLAVVIPGKTILLEKSFDCGSGNGEIDLGTLTIADDHDHDEVHQINKAADKPQLPRLIVKTLDSDGKPVPKAGIMFYDRNSRQTGQKQEFERVSKQTDDSGAADFGVIPNSFGCLQVTSSDNGLAGCYTLISASMTKCTQAKPSRANVQTEIKDGILTVTFTMTPHVDLEFNIVDDATNEIVFWSEIFYQDPATNRWWQFALVDGSQLQHNFIPISPQITRETIRISASGYETKVFRLPNELDRSQPIRRDIRLKPMPDVELKVLLPDGTPAEKAKLTFHYPNELDCLQEHVQLSDAQGIVSTEFPPNVDIGLLRLEHAGGTAELPMKELLDDVKRAQGEVDSAQHTTDKVEEAK